MNPKHQNIIEDYKGGMSLKNTAKKNKCSVSTVRHALMSNGVPTRPPHINFSKNDAYRTTPIPKIEKKRDLSQRTYAIRDELAVTAKVACKNLGGICHIDERYAIVDTQKYKVSVK